MSSELSSILSGSGLLHLVEAATALTELVVPSMLPPSAFSTETADFRSQQSAVSYSSKKKDSALANSSRAVSNDDLTLVSSSSLSSAPGTSHAMMYLPLRRTSSSSTASSVPSKGNNNDGNSKNDTKIFPMRLHALLADPTVIDVISWLPHGRSFVVLRPDIFATRVLPRYFAPEGSNSPNARNYPPIASKLGASLSSKDSNSTSHGVHKYPSFTRKLNRWGFRQISRGVDAGAFRHELFRLDDRELCRGMVCQKSRKPSNSNKSQLPEESCPKADTSNSISQQCSDADSTVSSSSKTSVASGTKRPYASTVSISGSESAAIKSRSSSVCHNSVFNARPNLPPKKRRTMTNLQSANVVDAIPSMTQCNHYSSSSHLTPSHPVPRNVVYKGYQSSGFSVAESELSSSSENLSVGSFDVARNIARHVPSPIAAMAQQQVPQQPRTTPSQAQLTMEAAAKVMLAHHFHQQQRAMALTSLMENSKRAMEAAGLRSSDSPLFPLAHQQTVSKPRLEVSKPCSGPLVVTADSSVVAVTVPLMRVQSLSAAPTNTVNPCTQPTSAQTAKSALYRAYMQALGQPLL